MDSNELRKFIFKVESSECKGTAFLVSPKYALTVEHAVGIDKEVKVYDRGQKINAKVIYKSGEENLDLDIAILELEKNINAEILSIVDYDIKENENWETYGYPKYDGDTGDILSGEGNKISQVFQLITGEKHNIKLKYNDVHIKDFEGFSGSPLIVNRKIVGIINSQRELQGEAIRLNALSVRYFKQLLNKYNINIEKIENRRNINSIFMVPYNKNRNFLGRKEVLEKLTQEFKIKNCEEKRIQILSGMNGVGKTQIAIEYAYKNQQEYKYVFWVNADNSSLFNGYKLIGENLNLINQNDTDQKVVINKVLNWFNKNDDWLLIFDNCKDYEQIYDYIPNYSYKGNIIITSTNPNWFDLNESIKIDVFNEEEVIQFIEKVLKIKDNEKSKLIAQELGYLPLALNQAIAYIKRTKKSIDEYIDLFHKEKLKLFEENYNRREYKETIKTVWKISLNKIKEEAKELQNLEGKTQNSAYLEDSIKLIRFLSLFSNDNIPKRKLNENLKNLMPLFLREIDEVDFDSITCILEEYALINIDENFYSMHSLIQMVLCEEMKENKEYNNYMGLVINFFDDILPNNLKTSDKLSNTSQLIPHVNFIINNIEEVDYKYIKLRYKFGIILSMNAQYEKAREILEESLRILDSFDERLLTLKVVTMSLLAGILKDIDELDESLYYYNKVEELYFFDTNTIPNNIIYGNYNNMGLLYLKNGKYKEAKKYFSKALKYTKKSSDFYAEELSTIWSNLVSVNCELNEYKEAEKNIQKALQIIKPIINKKNNNNNNLQYARLLNAKGLILSNKREYKKAMEQYKKALKINEKYYIPNHSEILTIKVNMALCMCNLEKIEDTNSINLMKEVINLNIEVLDENNIEVASNIHRLAQIYIKKNKYSDAIELLKKTKKIYINKFGRYAFDIVDIDIELIYCLMEMKENNNINLIIDLCNEVIDIDKNIDDYERIIEDLNQVIGALDELKLLDEAINLVKNTQIFILHKYGQNSVELNNTHEYIKYLNKEKLALEIYERFKTR